MRTIDVDALAQQVLDNIPRVIHDSGEPIDDPDLIAALERLEQLANEWTHATNEERRRKIAAEYLRLREWLRAVQ